MQTLHLRKCKPLIFCYLKSHIYYLDREQAGHCFSYLWDRTVFWTTNPLTLSTITAWFRLDPAAQTFVPRALVSVLSTNCSFPNSPFPVGSLLEGVSSQSRYKLESIKGAVQSSQPTNTVEFHSNTANRIIYLGGFEKNRQRITLNEQQFEVAVANKRTWVSYCKHWVQECIIKNKFQTATLEYINDNTRLAC